MRREEQLEKETVGVGVGDSFRFQGHSTFQKGQHARNDSENQGKG